MPISDARKAAYLNLMRIERDEAFSTEVIAAAADDLSKRDRSLCHKLTLGVLRKQRLLDYIAGLYSKKRPAQLDIEILTILRLAIYQIHFLDRIPDYTAINEAVELTRFAKKKSASGFVNAVLRKAAKWNGAAPDDPAMSAPGLSVSHPEWLFTKWERDFGPERAYLIANANNTEPQPSFRMTARYDALEKSQKEEIIARLKESAEINQSKLVQKGYTAVKIDEYLRELSDNGFIYFQDEASQLVAEIVLNQGGGYVLDVCGSPGSKATLISRNLTEDSLILAGELHFHRAKLMKENALRQGTDLPVIVLDGGGKLPFENNVFDTVLVDAPCSGTGTIRRNPEIRYRVSDASIAELQSKQLKILTKASKYLKSGGVLIYSTCSIEQEENEDVVGEFLKSNPGFGMSDIGSVDIESVEVGVLRTFPDLHETDGFFVACMRKQ